jgi:ABC-type branched-subunit amino acid transport system permease subunit
MEGYLLFLLLGVGAGAVYSLLGLGIVLQYRSSGVVNFAHGAMGMIIAYVYVSLTGSGKLWLIAFDVQLGSPWAIAPAMLVSAVYAAVLGIVVYGAVFRPLRHASALGKAVASVGLALALQAVAVLHFGVTAVTSAPILPTDPVTLTDGLTIPADRLWLGGIAVAVAAVLWAIAKFTRFGLATRGASESEKGALLLGYSPDRIALANWMLASVLAGISGVLFVQISSLAPGTYTLLVVPALAAAMMARFTSFAGVVIAAMVLGMLQSEAVKLNAEWSWVPIGIGGALPFLMIMAAMIWRGPALPSRGVLLERRAPRAGRPTNLAVPTVLGVAATVAGLFLLNGDYRFGLIQSMVAAIVCLSLVVLTGYTGQISLAQMAFAGVGGFTLSKLAAGSLPFPLTLVLSGLVAVPVGLLVGLPALRVRGINLAIATLAGGVAIDQLAFNSSQVSGGFAGASFPQLDFAGINLDIDANKAMDFPRPVFGLVVLALLTVLALSVANLRRTPTGRRLLAVRANERAAAAAGVDVAATKLYAFAVSSFVAGISGGIIGYTLGTLSTSSFNVSTSLMFLAIAFIGGIARVSGAIVAGLFLATGGLMPVVLDRLIGFGDYQVLVAGILLMFSAIAYPDGMAATFDAPIAAVKRRLGLTRTAGGTSGPPPPSEPPTSRIERETEVTA